MRAPSIRVMRVAASDPDLFESLMGRLGFRVVRRDTNPLSTTVQSEAVQAIASAICEDKNERIKLQPYHRQLKEMAEKLGYVVVLEGPNWHDHEEYQQLNRDAEEAERGFDNDMDLDDGEDHSGVPEEVRYLAPAGPPRGREQETPTGKALLDKIFADVNGQEDQPW